ncbi:replication-relaxation family protein [Halobacillus sp. B23F22_1]|uniref:replication-relaxation family protein n=1 Tax=Halobacillus sp. B23F22_1 TaxID=3459514 RepID=UPI00373E3377
MDFILSEKRKEVLETIDRFGVITNRQLEKFLSYMGVNTIRRGRQQLKELGFIEEKSFGRRKVSTITKKGSEYVGQIMTGASSSYSQLQHDLTVNEIVHALVQQYKEKGHSVTFLTEREVIRKAFLSLSYEEIKKPNKLRHLSKEVPDFLLNFRDQSFAFEVELNRKTHQRIEKKVQQYKQSVEENTYSRVFYICKDEGIRRHVESFAKGVGVDIHFLMLHEVIDDEEV